MQIYVAKSNIHFSGLDNAKMTCITQVSFIITIRKRHDYIDIRWSWKWNQYFYLGIWEDERSKIIFLISFKLVTRLNYSEQKWNKFINELWHINLYMNISNSNWHNSSIDSTKLNLLLYFSSLHDYVPPTTLIPLVHNSLGEKLWCEKRAF